MYFDALNARLLRNLQPHYQQNPSAMVRLSSKGSLVAQLTALIKRATCYNGLCLQIEGAKWQSVGEGACGKVFKSPCGMFVCKISRADAGYPLYANWAQQAWRTNPHAPQILWGEAIPYVDKGYMSLLEPLEKLSQDMEDVISPVQGKLYGYHVDADVCFTDHEEQIISTVLSLAEKSRVRVDVHNGNFMMRGKQWVLTDPLIG